MNQCISCQCYLNTRRKVSQNTFQKYLILFLFLNKLQVIFKFFLLRKNLIAICFFFDFFHCCVLALPRVPWEIPKKHVSRDNINDQRQLLDMTCTFVIGNVGLVLSLYPKDHTYITNHRMLLSISHFFKIIK